MFQMDTITLLITPWKTYHMIILLKLIDTKNYLNDVVLHDQTYFDYIQIFRVTFTSWIILRKQNITAPWVLQCSQQGKSITPVTDYIQSIMGNTSLV